MNLFLGNVDFLGKCCCVRFAKDYKCVYIYILGKQDLVDLSVIENAIYGSKS